MVATDRRSTGAQVDDESIELKIVTAAGDRYGDDVHLNVTSYNGNVLLTGEVPSTGGQGRDRQAREVDRAGAQASTTRWSIGPVAGSRRRSNDTYITSKVKTRFVESDKVSALDVKVVTERSVVYLMGIVTREEGDGRRRRSPRRPSGVARVVKLFEYTN